VTEVIRPIDADNHYYETLDAFTRHLDPAFKRRGVQVMKNGTHTELVIGGKVNGFIPNPTFDPVIVPGCMDLQFRGKIPEGVDPRSLTRVEPISACYQDRDARLEKLDEQSLEAVLLFPTLGCGVEQALVDDGIELRHMTCNCTVPMYRTSVPTVPAGPFHGPLVVSMRPMKPVDAIRAVQITTRFPSVHGAPVHLGKPEMIGIKDIGKPDWGDPVPVHDDEIPVFWACGVTPQSVIMAVRPEFCITHYPGAMLVTDRRNTEFAIM